MPKQISPSEAAEVQIAYPMASVVIFPPFSKRYSLAEGFVVESDLNHTLKLTSSAAAKSRSASSARDARTFVSPLKALPNLPELVQEAVERVRELELLELSLAVVP